MRAISWIVLGFLLVFSLPSFAQADTSGEITGIISDADTKELLPFGSVRLVKSDNTTDTQVAGEAVEANGSFRFKNIAYGTYVVVISYVGYAPQRLVINLSAPILNLGSIALRTDAQLLNEVQVTAEKDIISLAADKRVFQVSKSLNSVGGTAETILRNLPSVSVDESGNASIRNMSTAIYIDGKPTQLTLAQVPANQIETVEIIANPSARYDASTSGGIVNLVLKKNRDNGLTGTVGAGYGTNQRLDANLNLNYHRNKWNYGLLYSYNSSKIPQPGYVNRTNFSNGIPTSYFNQNTLTQQKNQFQNGKIAVDYSPSNFQTFSLSGSLVSGEFNSDSQQSFAYRDAENRITSTGNRQTIPSNTFTNAGLGFDWHKTFTQKGRDLRFLSSLNHLQVSNAAVWNTVAFDDLQRPVAVGTETDNISGRQLGSQYLAQLDYIRPLNDSTRFEMGLRSFTSSRDQQYFFSKLNPETQLYELQQTYSQNSLVNETINAAYVIYHKKLKKDFEMDAGLRFEQSFLHGVSRFDDTSFGFNYPGKNGKNFFRAFFPSLIISKKYGEDSEVSFGLSRKIGRPGFRNLFAGIQSNDPQNITIGNPALQPEFINTAEINYNQTFGGLTWLSTVYFIYEANTLKPFTQPLATDPTILVTTFINAKADIQYGMDNTLKYTLKDFSILGNVNLFNFVLQTADITRQQIVSRSKLTVSYKFSNSWSLQLNGNADSKSPTLQGYRLPIYGMDVAVRKPFMNNRANLVIAVNDVFNSRKYQSIFERENLFQTTMSRRDIRSVKVSLQFPLGKAGTTNTKKAPKLERSDVDMN